MRISKGSVFQFVKYSIVGIINTIVSASVMVILGSLEVAYPVYTAIGYVVGIANSLIWNYKFTFRHSSTNMGFVVFKFCLVALLLLGIVQLLQFFGIQVLKLPEVLVVAFGMFFYTLAGYFINKSYVFKKGEQYA